MLFRSQTNRTCLGLDVYVTTLVAQTGENGQFVETEYSTTTTQTHWRAPGVRDLRGESPTATLRRCRAQQKRVVLETQTTAGAKHNKSNDV